MTWDRCTGEVESINPLFGGAPDTPRLQPWRGLAAMTDKVQSL